MSTTYDTGIYLDQDDQEEPLKRITARDFMDFPELIKVGTGVTLSTAFGSLHRPYTVIAVRRGGKELDIQADTVTVETPGRDWADDGVKTYTPNPNGRVETITKRNDGSYIAKGTPKARYSSRYHIGYRRDWTDLSI